MRSNAWRWTASPRTGAPPAALEQTGGGHDRRLLARRDVLRPPWRHGPPQRNVRYQAVSKGLVTFGWLSRWRRQSATGSRLGRFSHLHSVIGWHKGGVQSFAWFITRPLPGLPPLAKPLHKQRCTSKGFCSRSMCVARPREFVCDRLDRHDAVGLALLAHVKALGLRAIAQREVGSLHKRPSEVLVAILRVAFALLLAIALAPAVDTRQ